MESATLETGLAALLAEALAAAAAGVPPSEPAVGYSPVEIATLALRWIGKGIFERGGVPLMRSTLDAVCRVSVAGPWFRHLAAEAWVGIGTWPDLPQAPPKSGQMPY
jgi:hypothetical protein